MALPSLTPSVDNMYELSDLFYSYHADELPQLRPLWNLCASLSETPAEVRDRDFYNLSDKPALQSEFEALNRVPDARDVLEREYLRFTEKQARKAEVLAEGSPYIIRDNYVRFLRSRELRQTLEAAANGILGGGCELTGDFLYPPGSFREWHTNRYNLPGWRMYVINVEQANQSCFRFISPRTGALVSISERPGTVHFFRVDPERLLFHCVISRSTWRWSKGFRIGDDWRNHLGLPRCAVPAASSDQERA